MEENKMNTLKEKCPKCNGSGEITTYPIVSLSGRTLKKYYNTETCPNCEDGWDWKFYKKRDCPDCNTSPTLGCPKCEAQGTQIEPVKDGDIKECPVPNCHQMSKCKICNNRRFILIKELLDDGWGLK